MMIIIAIIITPYLLTAHFNSIYTQARTTKQQSTERHCMLTAQDWKGKLTLLETRWLGDDTPGNENFDCIWLNSHENHEGVLYADNFVFIFYTRAGIINSLGALQHQAAGSPSVWIRKEVHAYWPNWWHSQVLSYRQPRDILESSLNHLQNWELGGVTEKKPNPTNKQTKTKTQTQNKSSVSTNITSWEFNKILEEQV